MASPEDYKNMMKEKFGEKGVQFVSALQDGGDISMAELAKKLNISKSDMKKMYDYMIDQGSLFRFKRFHL